MAGNLIEQMNILKGLSDEALQGEMQSPSGAVPPYLVLTEVGRRKDMRSRYEGEAARQKRRTTVAEDLVMPMGGQMRPVGGMPTGGIAAAEVPGFASGGLIDYGALETRYNDRLNSLGAGRDRARALALIAAGAGIMGGKHSNTLRNVGEGISGALPVYQDAMSAIDTDELNLMRGLTDLGQLQTQLAQGGSESYFAPIAGTVGDKPVFIQFGNKGGVRTADGLPEGFTPQSRFEKIDLGDKYRITDTTTGETWYETKQGAPGTNMNVEGTGTDRTMAPAPGSEEAVKREELGAKRETADAATALTADVVTTDIDRAIGAISDNPIFTTGAGAWATENLGVGPAADVKRLIETVKANVSFDKLQQMRASSPTGAALGPVSDFENRLLQATIGNLELAQNKEQLLYNLERVKDIYTQIVTTGIKDPNAGPTSPPVSGTVGDVEFTVEP